VSDDADVEIRIVQVQGFTTLPDTGTGPLNPIAFALTSLLMLAAGAVMAYRYRSVFREAVRQRVSVNFIAQ
jgi:LPXTG-motif cell wall-anchored protein